VFIRRAFTNFLEVHSEALVAVSAPVDWTIDWRWLAEAPADDGFPDESLPMNLCQVRAPS
jgi:hypothetical protein